VTVEVSEALSLRNAEPDSLLFAATFDAAWTRIRETHYSPELNGIDWEMVRSELLPKATAARSEEELRGVIREMLSRLGESHFVLISAAGASSLGGSTGEGDPGFEVRWVEGELLVVRVREGSASAQAGVHPGWVVDALDGLSVDSLITQLRSGGLPGGEGKEILQWLPVLARNRAMGEVGTTVAVRFRDERDAQRNVELRRDPPASEATRIGNLPPIRAETMHRIETLPDGSRIGVLSWSAWVPSIVPVIAEAMDTFRGLEGIVLDLRGNPGGLGALAMGVGGHFLDGRESLGTMLMRETTLRFVTNPQRVSRSGERVDPYAGPLAILLDPLSASTSEIFAAGMQSLGRARIFGERSAGQALPSLITPLPNGDRLMHAVADFVAPNGERLEGEGVAPDVEVSLQREALLRGRDPVLDAAFQWIRTQR
jgi:carboxyl-terminal processing protease